MYFNSNKNDTNIDKDFNNNKNILSTIISFFNKFKVPIIIGIVIIIIIIVIIIFTSNNNSNNTITPNVETYLVLSGDEVINIAQGDDYIEPGYKAYNENNEDLTKDVDITTNLNINQVGEYEITYKIGNVTKTRKINIIDKNNTTNEYTYIYLNTVNNNVDIYLKVGEKYTEPGYKVYSTSGKNLNDSVKITGSVDTSKRGNYTLTYSLTDENNKTITVTRTVIVMDTDINLSLNTTSYTNKNVEINVKVIDNYFDYLILPDGTKVTKSTYTYTVSKNGTYKFTAYSKKGMVKSSSIEVKNIDKTAPTGSCSGSYEKGTSSINISANDNIGISKYVIDNKTYTNKNITINKEIETAKITIYDKAGNTKNISCNLEEKNRLLEMHFIASQPYDDAILIRTNKATIFIDGGQWDCRKKITPYLQTIGVTKIDAMIGSHLHFNHIQMQADILEKFEVDNIYYPDDLFTCASRDSCDTRDQNYILAKLKEQNKTPTVVKPGTKITVGDMELYFIGPPKISTGLYSQNLNSFMIILKYYDNTFMFTGDAGGSTLDTTYLKKYADQLGISLDIDVLKYPHHGNATLSNTFLEKTKPEYTIVPNYNASQFPASSNQNKLKQYNVKMYRQSDSKTGNILVTSDGSKIKIYNNVVGEDYKR